VSGSEARLDPPRLRALDGLRGVAALIVVFHHIAMMWPPLADLFYDAGAHVPVLASVVAYTPLHLLWAGPEAVIVFFVLSGFVLVLPFTDAPTGWAGYYAKRFVRLYLPVAAAVGLAVYWALVVPRRFGPGATHWLQAQALQPTLHFATTDLLLLRDPPGLLDGPLWSLRWEVWFSLLLPLYALAAMRLRSLWPVKLAALLVATAIGTARGTHWLEFLPMFGIGALMAVERDSLRRLVARVTRRGGALVAAAALLLLDVDWSCAAVHGAGGYAAGAAESGVALGAAAIVALVLGWRPAVHAAERRPLQWLGSRSFSLYLVHLPLLLSLAVVLHSPPLVGLLGLPLSLLLADLFYRLVDAPAHRLSRSVGRAVSPPPIGKTAPAG
jgi:peptidoglycan/LPS O-acetylase OafA/YrhL